MWRRDFRRSSRSCRWSSSTFLTPVGSSLTEQYVAVHADVARAGGDVGEVPHLLSDDGLDPVPRVSTLSGSTRRPAHRQPSCGAAADTSDLSSNGKVAVGADSSGTRAARQNRRGLAVAKRVAKSLTRCQPVDPRKSTGRPNAYPKRGHLLWRTNCYHYR